MQLELSDDLTGEIFLQKKYAQNFDTGRTIQEAEHRFDIPDYSICLSEKWFEGAHICRCKINAFNKGKFHLKWSKDHLAFIYCLSGSISFILDDKEQQFLLSNDEKHNFLIGYFKDLTVSFSAAAEFVYIQLTQVQYKKLTGEYPENNAMMFHSLQTDPEINLVLHNLINQRNHNCIKRVALEGKIYELLVYYVNKTHHKPGHSLKKDDVERLLYAKQLVELNIQHPNSLIELSRKVGINDYKLKKGFKELTGNTVFGYLYKIRMEKAYYYLSIEKKNVNEVSFLVGYKNAQHFIAAFKKKYRILPGGLNKDKFLNANV